MQIQNEKLEIQKTKLKTKAMGNEFVGNYWFRG